MTSSDIRLVARFDRWAVAGMFLINGIIVGSWAPHIPGFVARLGISEFTLGLLILGYGLGATATMAVAGHMIARFGSGKTLCLFASLLVLMLPLAVLKTELWAAVIVLALFGSVVGGMDVAMNANVVAVEKQSGRAIMSKSHGFWSLGGFAGGSLGGIGIQAFGAIEHAVVVTIVAALAVALAFPHINEGIDHAQDPKNRRFKWPRQPGIYILAAMALLCMCAEGSVLNWSALYLQKDLLSDTAVVGFAFAGFSGAMALTRFLGDSIRNRFGASTTFRMSAFLSCASMLVAGLAPWPWLAIAAFALCGIGTANLVPILFSAAGKQPGINAGVGLSVVTTIGHVGILLAPSIIGFFAAYVGLSAVYVAIALMLGSLSMLAGRTATADDM